MCSCLSANLSPSGKFELCEECRLEEEREDDNESMHQMGLTPRQIEEVRQMIQSALDTGYA